MEPRTVATSSTIHLGNLPTVTREELKARSPPLAMAERGATKEGLLAKLIARAIDDYRRALWPALTGQGTGRTSRAGAKARCDSAEEHMALLVALRAQSDAVFHAEDESDAMTRSVYTEPLEKLLREGVADGSLRDLDPLETATVLFDLVGWTYIHLRNGHGWKPNRAQRATLDPVLHGLLAHNVARLKE